MTTDVVIIGGGVSGLTTARQLAARGLSVQVLERQVRPGGNAVSERIGGFLMEHGPSTVNAAMPEALGLQQELGLAGDLSELGAGVKYRYLQSEGRLHQISVHALGFLMSSYLSPAARLRVLWEAFVPARRAPGDETVADYWSRRFGRQFAERVIDPLIGGLFAARAEDLSMASVFPKLLDMERLHGSVIRGVVKARFKGGGMPGRRLYSWRDGIGSLPRALAVDLGPLVKTGVTVRGIKRGLEGYIVDAGDKGLIRARSVVLATQPHVTSDLLSRLDEEAACAASEIRSPALAVVYFGYRRDQVAHPLDGLGYLTPAAEGRSVSGALFASTMFDGRAPEGHVALSAYLGGSRAPELAGLCEADLMAEVRAEYADVLGVRGEPVVSRVRRWPLGIPQAGLGHADRVERLRGLNQRSPGLHVTGNYLSGPSVAACVAEAVITADRVAEELASFSSLPEAPILKSALS